MFYKACLTRSSVALHKQSTQSLTLSKLIETGKALKGANKDGGKAQVGITRPQSTIPSIIEQFQQALDELEIEIVRIAVCRCPYGL
jgi:hypothetical protein